MSDRRNQRDQGPPRLLGEVAAVVVSDLRFRRHVEHLHRLGPRAVGEFLAEFGVEYSIRTAIDTKLARYAELEPETIELTGGGDFWPTPMHEANP